MAGKTTFPERLERIMTHYRLSQTEMAERLQVSRGQISHWLSGRNSPGLESLERILKAFPAVNPDWLIMEKGPFLREEMLTSPSLFSASAGSSPAQADLPPSPTGGPESSPAVPSSPPPAAEEPPPAPPPDQEPGRPSSEHAPLSERTDRLFSSDESGSAAPADAPPPAAGEQATDEPAAYFHVSEQPIMVILFYPNNRFQTFYPGSIANPSHHDRKDSSD